MDILLLHESQAQEFLPTSAKEMSMDWGIFSKIELIRKLAICSIEKDNIWRLLNDEIQELKARNSDLIKENDFYKELKQKLSLFGRGLK